MANWIEKTQRNERLLANEDFRDFLADVAWRGGLLTGTAGLTEEATARCASLRELVMGVVTNASNGGDFLKQLFDRTYASRLKKRTEEQKNGEDKR